MPAKGASPTKLQELRGHSAPNDRARGGDPEPQTDRDDPEARHLTTRILAKHNLPLAIRSERPVNHQHKEEEIVLELRQRGSLEASSEQRGDITSSKNAS